jgi:hypothetical protein
MDVSSRLGVEAMASVGERADEDGHMILYVGGTDDLSTEFDNHRKANCFRRHDANRISVFVDGLEASRRVVESELINFYDPACNE